MMVLATLMGLILAASTNVDGGEQGSVRGKREAFAACMFDKAPFKTEKWVYEESKSFIEPWPQPQGASDFHSEVCVTHDALVSIFPSRSTTEMWGVLREEKYRRLARCMIGKGSAVINAIKKTPSDGRSLERDRGFPASITNAGRACDRRFFSLVKRNWMTQYELLQHLRAIVVNA